MRATRWIGLVVAVAVLAGAGAATARAEDEGAHVHGTPQRGENELFEPTSKRRFDDVEHWTKVFDDPERDAWQQPARLVEALAIRPGDVVADLGAGTGYFLAHLSRAVGRTGTVLAADIEPALVVYLRERAEREGLANVTPVLTSAAHARLPRGSVDLVVIVDTYHHLPERRAYLDDLAASLADEGRVAVVDWRKKELPVGPPLDHKLARDQVVREMDLAGYLLEAEHDFLDYQYFLVFGRR